MTVLEPDCHVLLAALDASIGKPLAGFEGIVLGASEKEWMRAVLLSAAGFSD